MSVKRQNFGNSVTDCMDKGKFRLISKHDKEKYFIFKKY